MKNIIYLVLISIIFVSLYGHTHAAISTKRSFGGRVIATTIASVTCAAQYGPLSIRPVGAFPATSYIIKSTSKTIGVGSWILGLYDTVPDAGSCQLETPLGPVPYATFLISNPWGASKPL